LAYIGPLEKKKGELMDVRETAMGF